MHKKQTVLFTALFFLILSVFLLFLSRIGLITPLSDFFGLVFSPVEKLTYTIFHKDSDSVQVKVLKDENTKLRSELVKEKTIENQNNALNDQFQTATPKSQSLLPAVVIGAPGFLPGFSQPEYLVLDKGKQDGVSAGQAVVVKNNLIGIIGTVSQRRSSVLFLQQISAIAAKTVETNAVGIINANDSGELTFNNVLLSDTLKKDDLIVTRGNLDKNGKGFVPNLVIGKIVSVDKKPSALFQSARIKGFVDMTKLEMVFIIINP